MNKYTLYLGHGRSVVVEGETARKAITAYIRTQMAPMTASDGRWVVRNEKNAAGTRNTGRVITRWICGFGACATSIEVVEG